MSLTDAHANHLISFRIPLELLENAGVQSMTDLECRETLGVHGYQGLDLGGIYFPCHDPLTGHRNGARVRLDHPIGDQKYLSEQGCCHLFFAPVPREWLADASTPLVSVEAAQYALALRALAQRQGMKLIVIALGGCWGWKRTTGKQGLPDGGTENTTGPSPDFDLLRWPERQAIV